MCLGARTRRRPLSPTRRRPHCKEKFRSLRIFDYKKGHSINPDWGIAQAGDTSFLRWTRHMQKPFIKTQNMSDLHLRTRFVSILAFIVVTYFATSRLDLGESTSKNRYSYLVPGSREVRIVTQACCLRHSKLTNGGFVPSFVCTLITHCLCR